MFDFFLTDALIGQVVGTISAYDPDADAVLRFAFSDPKSASSDEGFEVDPAQYDFRVSKSSVQFHLPTNWFSFLFIHFSF